MPLRERRFAAARQRASKSPPWLAEAPHEDMRLSFSEAPNPMLRNDVADRAALREQHSPRDATKAKLTVAAPRRRTPRSVDATRQDPLAMVYRTAEVSRVSHGHDIGGVGDGNGLESSSFYSTPSSYATGLLAPAIGIGTEVIAASQRLTSQSASWWAAQAFKPSESVMAFDIIRASTLQTEMQRRNLVRKAAALQSRVEAIRRRRAASPGREPTNGRLDPSSPAVHNKPRPPSRPRIAGMLHIDPRRPQTSPRVLALQQDAETRPFSAYADGSVVAADGTAPAATQSLHPPIASPRAQAAARNLRPLTRAPGGERSEVPVPVSAPSSPRVLSCGVGVGAGGASAESRSESPSQPVRTRGSNPRLCSMVESV